MINIREQVKLDMTELSKLINVPAKAFKYLEDMHDQELESYSNMKTHEITDLIIQLS